MDISQPLFQLFTRLRLAELPLGLDDYALMLQAVAAGKGATRPALARLCRALWVRTADPALVRLFEMYFERIIPKDYGRLPDTQPDKEERPSTPPPPKAEKPTQELPKIENPAPQEKPQTEAGKEGAPAPAPTPKPVMADVGQQYEVTRTLDEIGQMKMGFEGDTAIDVTTQAYYSFSSDYLPVSRRQMKQNWRYLRRAARFGPPVELDVEATVHKIAQSGMMTDPVLRPRRVNRTDLILLLDHGGSMVPFHGLSERLVETAVRGGKLGQASVYYFHDCPITHFYCNTTFRESELIVNRLQKMHPLHSSVLIFSDGGAARGRFDPKRVDATLQFLQQLKAVVRHVAWLNPMPQPRWAGTSAEQITAVVPMFEANPIGMHGAIKALRGHRPHALERVR